MQTGYFSLLVKDYSNVVEHRFIFKDIYTSQVKILTRPEEVFSHIQYAYQRVSQTLRMICYMYTVAYACNYIYTSLQQYSSCSYIATSCIWYNINYIRSYVCIYFPVYNSITYTNASAVMYIH